MFTTKLSPKQQKFVTEYLIDLNATQAAIRSGYSPRTAQEQSSRLLSKAIIKEQLEEARKMQIEKTNVTVQYVLNNIIETIERCKQVAPGETKFDSGAVLKGNELLGKYLKMFTDKVEHSGTVGIADAIRAAKDGKQTTK